MRLSTKTTVVLLLVVKLEFSVCNRRHLGENYNRLSFLVSFVDGDIGFMYLIELGRLDLWFTISENRTFPTSSVPRSCLDHKSMIFYHADVCAQNVLSHFSHFRDAPDRSLMYDFCRRCRIKDA